jgi:hypothetical protein
MREHLGGHGRGETQPHHGVEEAAARHAAAANFADQVAQFELVHDCYSGPAEIEKRA